MSDFGPMIAVAAAPLIVVTGGATLWWSHQRMQVALREQKLPRRKPWGMTGATAGDRDLQRSHNDRRERWERVAKPFRIQQAITLVLALIAACGLVAYVLR